jgi:hypothetical protein
MNRTVWTPTLAWLAAASVALMLALAAPSETNVMGRLLTPTLKRLDQQRVVFPRGVPGDRVLALVGFERAHRAEIDSWVRGLGLDQEPSIPWIKMPVYDDPGDEGRRSAIEHRLQARHAGDSAQYRLLPVFTNREAFIRAAALSGAEHASVLVLNRDGTVLARAEGVFDQNKALALRETLLAQQRN